MSVERELKFQALAPPSEIFWLRLQAFKIAWTRGSTALVTTDGVKNKSWLKHYLSASIVSSSSLAPLFCGTIEEWAKQNMLFQNSVVTEVTSRALANIVIMWA